MADQLSEDRAMGYPPDSHVIDLCLQGDIQQYRHLVSRYHPAVRAFLRGRLGPGADLDEAVQETFVRAYSALARLRKPSSFFPWLLAIAARVSQEQIRRRSRQRRFEPLPDLPDPHPANPEDADDPLRRAVTTLPGAYRRVILLRYYAGLSCTEIAADLNRPVGTVSKMLSRAYGLLRQELEKKPEVRS